MLDRRLVVLGWLLAPVPAFAAPCKAPRILFVCPAGSVKSAIAREELKKIAKSQGIRVHAESRGINPENHVSSSLAQHLRMDGIDPRAEPLRRFTPEDTKRADIVVAFDQAAGAPGLEAARRWQIASWNSQYDDAKSDTLKNVRQLLYEIKQRQC